MRVDSPKVDGYRIVSNYTQLKSRGNGLYYGLCPLHNEDTPSFHFNANANVFYCFGCKRGGNIFQFISYVEKIPISEVNDFLNKRYGYEITTKRERKDNALETFWEIAKNLNDENKVEEFLLKKIGSTSFKELFVYVPQENHEKLKQEVEKLGIADVLVEKGIFNRHEETKRLSFVFHTRIFTPIKSKSGNIVGFISRLINPEAIAYKYILSKFSKKYHLALYNEALELYRKGDLKQVFVVESVFDALALLSKNVPAIALLGTSISLEQINLLNAFDKVVFLLDQDKPGLMSYHMISKTIIETNRASFITLFAFHDFGKDVDEILISTDLDTFLNSLKYKTVYDAFIDFTLNDIKLASPALKNKEIFREELIRRFMKIFKLYNVNEHAYNLMIRLSERAKYPLDILVRRVDYAIKRENVELASSVSSFIPEYIPPKERKFLRGLMFALENNVSIHEEVKQKLLKYNYKSLTAKAIVEFLLGVRQEISEDEYALFVDIVPEEIKLEQLFEEKQDKSDRIISIAKRLGFKSFEKVKDLLETQEELDTTKENIANVIYE